jgi:hypothetical protein
MAAGVRRLALSLAGAALVLGARVEVARAAGTPVYSLSIGYNGVPPTAPSGLPPLRFADDDATSFHEFARQLSTRSILLAVLDRDTQQRFPDAAESARPPSLVEVRRAVHELEVEVQAAVAKGDEPVVFIFYSGHGTTGADGQAGLSLLDGALTRDALYDEVLAPLTARFVHLFIDACNAEAVVRPRDLQAEVVDPPPGELGDYLRAETLARFPNVGAVMASTVGAQAHEWDVYQSGIFTHEVLSALRGGADVDGNHLVEYSELAAFLAAANRDVEDPRARPRCVVHPPPLDPRVALVDVQHLRQTAYLQGEAGTLGAFYVEDARGNRLLDLRVERHLPVLLALPGNEVLFLRNDRGEVTLSPAAGATVRIESLRLATAEVRARGSLDSALRRGLFATRFGPAYYRGFVDRRDDLVPVATVDDEPMQEPSPPAPATAQRDRRRAQVSFVASGTLALGAAIAGGLAWSAHHDFDETTFERPAMEARDRYERDATLAIGTLIGAVVAGGIGAFFWARASSHE